MSAFLNNTTCFLEKEQWQALIREAVSEDLTLAQDKDFALALWGGLIEMPKLFHQTTELLLSPSPPPQKDFDDLIGRLLAKRKNLEIWLSSIKKRPIVKVACGLGEDQYGVVRFTTNFNYRILGPWCLTRVALRGTYVVCRMVKSRLLYALSPSTFRDSEIEAQGIAHRIINLEEEMASFKDSALVWNQYMAQGTWIAKGIVETKDLWSEGWETNQGPIERCKFEKWNQIIGRKLLV